MRRSASDPRLSEPGEEVELPLIFFVDSMISESSLPFAAQWNQNRLAYDRNELAGDEKFFDLLEETLKDQNDEASERLAVFYTCLGLGFTGIYFRQPEYLRKTMLTDRTPDQAPGRGRPDLHACARNATRALTTRNLVEPPSRMLAFVGILFLCFTLAVCDFLFLSLPHLFSKSQSFAGEHFEAGSFEVYRTEISSYATISDLPGPVKWTLGVLGVGSLGHWLAPGIWQMDFPAWCL